MAYSEVKELVESFARLNRLRQSLSNISQEIQKEKEFIKNHAMYRSFLSDEERDNVDLPIELPKVTPGRP